MIAGTMTPAATWGAVGEKRSLRSATRTTRRYVYWASTMREMRTARLVKVAIVAGLYALLLAGCQSGTLTGEQRTCRATGLFTTQKVTCTGSVGTVRGSPYLSTIEADEDLDGTYRLDATIVVGQGTMKAHVTDASDERVGGEVSPEAPLRIFAIVDFEGDEQEVDVDLKVAEKEVVRNLRYEATLIRQD